ncbi:BrkA autotransporter [Saezia sanguinis]|uniref:BrkA autotransporter n=1 Tax=Saezia sanguinis TaxID=1965230 RepID=A0A433SAF8_9BURK|nr:autotransporter outer membrane beta-barrel domain-containing protein [Saezia sanguinis]RUS65644.1 BrkA autotransporter [Saezia sanguinis]
MAAKPLHLNTRSHFGKTPVTLAIAVLGTLSLQAYAQVSIGDSTTTVDLDSYSGNSATVNPGITVNVSNGPAIRAQNTSWTLENAGTLSSTDSNAFAVHLQNGSAFNNAGTVSGTGGGITSINSAASVVNFGVIESSSGYAVNLRAGGDIQNKTGARITGSTAGIYLINSSDTIINNGTIEGTNGAGVILEGGTVRLRNEASGLITGTTYGVRLVNGSQTVINVGLISASNGNGVDLSAGGTVTNAQGAVISGQNVGVYTMNGSAQVTTAGVISGGNNSVIFATGGGTLTMQTGALLYGAALGGNTSNIILQGTGTASNDFLSFGSLNMTGSEWSLVGRTEARATTVSSGTLFIGLPGYTAGATLVADTVQIQPGTRMAGYNSTVEGAVTNSGTLYVGSGYPYAAGAATASLNIAGTLNNAGQTILSSGAPYGNTLNIQGNYNGTGGSLTLGALLDDDHVGALANQQADRMLVRGNVTGSTPVNVLTVAETRAATSATTLVANPSNLPAGAYVRAGGEVVSPTSGVSIIQVSGTSTEGAFTMSKPYVTGGTPYQYKIYAFGPGSSNGSASASQNLVGNSGTYWDYRLTHAYLTAIPLPPGEVISFPGIDGGDGDGSGGSGGSGGGSGGSGGSGGGFVVMPDDIRWKVAPQVPSYISLPGALFSAGIQDVDNLHRRLGEVRSSQAVGVPDTDGEVFARVYGSQTDYRTNVGFSDYGFDAKQDYSALQFGSSATLHEDKYGGVFRLGGAVTLGHSRLTPDADDGNSVTKTDTQSFSAIGTYLHPDGWYVDVVLSMGRLKANTRTETYGNLQVASIKGHSYTASVETGYPFALGDSGFNLEPQLQYIWQNLQFKDFVDIDNIRTKLGHQSQSVLRAGLRLTRPIDTHDGAQLTPYVRLNYLYGLNNSNSVNVGLTDFDLGKYGQAYQVGAGVSGMINKRLSLYGEFSWQDKVGSAGWSGWQFTGGLRYMFGGGK